MTRRLPLRTLHWTERKRLGHAAIDRQHRQLYQLVQAFRPGRMSRRAAVTGLETLIAAVKEHFAHEEELMRRARYPHLDGHRALHQGLVDEVAAAYGMVRLGTRTLDHELVLRLFLWLEHHTSEADRSVVAHLAGAG